MTLVTSVIDNRAVSGAKAVGHRCDPYTRAMLKQMGRWTLGLQSLLNCMTK